MPIDAIYAYIQDDYEQEGYSDAMCNADMAYKESKKEIIKNGLKMLFEQVRLRYESDIRDINVQIDYCGYSRVDYFFYVFESKERYL